MFIRTYIAIGSNLHNPVAQVRSAITALGKLSDCQLVAQASLYQTPPLPPVTEQADFINTVVTLDTRLKPEQLLETLLEIERQHGRVRRERWGARTLDLDLLLYGTQIINTPALTIPHPGLTQRNFVVYPLAEIAPDLVLPTGELIHDVMLHLSQPLKFTG